MRPTQLTLAVAALLTCSHTAVAQGLADYATPRPVPPGRSIVVGFLGGFDRWDDPHRGVRKVVLDLRSRGLYADSASNHRYRTALKFLRQALDTNRNGRIDPPEAAAARIVLFGQSWGGATAIKVARALERQGVPVLLTVQVDSVGLDDAVIPSNVRSAANFYQHDFLTIQGQREIRAADPSRTRILGNVQFSYPAAPARGSDASWLRRTVGRSHVSMELDPRVWSTVEKLILDAAAH